MIISSHAYLYPGIIPLDGFQLSGDPIQAWIPYFQSIPQHQPLDGQYKPMLSSQIFPSCILVKISKSAKMAVWISYLDSIFGALPFPTYVHS